MAQLSSTQWNLRKSSTLLLCVIYTMILTGCSSTESTSLISTPLPSFPVQFPTKFPIPINVIDPRLYRSHVLRAIKRDDARFVSNVINSYPALLATKDYLGNSLLNIAAIHRSYNCISLLIKLGANINKPDSFGDTLSDLSRQDRKIKNILGEK